MITKPPAPCRRLAWGGLAAVLYLASALWTARGLLPVRVLYDGFVPPPPYRWVRPPAALAAENQSPQGGAGSIALTAGGSEYASVATGDGQAVIIFPLDGIAPSGGESAARITLLPVDPAMINSAPSGLRFDGNAYRIEGAYVNARRPVMLRKPVTIVLRYPSTGTRVLRSTGPAWTVLRSTAYHMSLQTVAESDRLGIFAAGASLGGPAAFLAGLSRSALLVLWTALALVLGLLLRYRVRRRAPGTGLRG